MKRLPELFARKKTNVLNMYCTAGFPELHSTIEVMNALQENGADIIELGMPYSDPLADGPIIQHSSSIALQNGMTINELFDQLKKLRDTITIPVLFMGYMNPVLQYGFERFCEDAAKVGVDGLILPDLPPYEFETSYRSIIEKNGLDFIFLVTPETSTERIIQLDQLSSGFLYAVSSSSTTGGEKKQSSSLEYLQKLQNLNLKNPVLVGFGIGDRAGFTAACQHAQGAIIGSAYIKALGKGGNVKTVTKSFLSSILEE